MKQDCKSPTHKAYRDAGETAAIQAYLVEKAMREANVKLDAGQVVDWKAVFTDAAERGQYAVKALDDAERAVNAHFDRGCRNIS